MLDPRTVLNAESMVPREEGFDRHRPGYPGSLGGDYEDEFFKKIRKFARKAVHRVKGIASKVAPLAMPMLRKLAPMALPMLKRLAPLAATSIGAALGGPAGAMLAGRLASAALQEAEHEGEAEAEASFEESDALFEETSGDPAAYLEMEEAAHRVALSPSGGVDRYVTRLVVSAAMLYRHNPNIRRNLGAIIQGTAALTQSLARNPRTRHVVRLVPTIIERALARLARMRFVSRRAIILVLSQETGRVLGSPHRSRMAYQRHRAAVQGGNPGRYPRRY